MYQGIQSNESVQPCPDCGITICNCNNCHTMHCDSETLCSYMKTIARMGIQKPDHPAMSSAISDDYTTNVSVYTTKIDEKYDLKNVSSLDEDLV